MENGSIKDVQQNLGVVRKSVTLDKTLVDEGNVDVTAESAAAHTSETNGATANGKSANGDVKSAEDKRRDEVTQEALKTGPTARLQCEYYLETSVHRSYQIQMS